jgi:penicillin-binding protein 1B
LTRRPPNLYSRRRLQVMMLLLTLAMLPPVLGSFVLIYHYLRYSELVEQRLQGERWLIPSRIYSAPVLLREGMLVSESDLVRILNSLRYERRPERPSAPGQFAVDTAGLTLFPRPGPGVADEPLVLGLGKSGLTSIRGRQTGTRYRVQQLEPALVTYLFDESREKRRLVRYQELPDHLINAILAIEDRRFFSHPGLDPFRIVGAAIRNIRAESYIQGGSTITQQLVKNFFLTPERTIRRKAQEALLAFVLERRADKQDILELYVNEIYLGQQGSFSINGVGEAARRYFHKDVANLALAESAMIAGMIQSPNPYNPYRHPKRATERRNLVLRAMLEAGFIDEPTLLSATAQPLHVETPTADVTATPYFVDLVQSQLAKRYGGDELVTQNLSIYTSLDLHLQGFATEALRRGLESLDEKIRKRKRPPAEPVQGALIVLEPQTGAVLALVGGRSYGTSQYNRAIQAKRQPGSTFKPFVYLAAFEATFDDPALPPITPATVVEDAPTVFFFEDKEYIPHNYEDKYLGLLTLRRALARSQNVATVKVAEMVGYNRVAELWSQKMGISEIPAYPALALGSFEATPFELATAYNVLANGGLKIDPVTILRVQDEDGQTIEQYRPPVPLRVVREESAFLVTNMLRSVMTEGTAASSRGLGFDADAAGKTGTTNDTRDAWFAGYTPNLLCVVWVGFDDNTPLNLDGARAALPIWVDFMKHALAGQESPPFVAPAEGIVFVEIDRETGLRATPACPEPVMEAFVAGTEPMEMCFYH